MSYLESVRRKVSKIKSPLFYGTVRSVRGLLIEAQGFTRPLPVGTQCMIFPPKMDAILAEVIGFREGNILLMAFAAPQGICAGTRIEVSQTQFCIAPSPAWLGRVLNGSAEPLDDKGLLQNGGTEYPVYHSPLPAHQRQRVGPRLDLGVRALNTFTTCCEGQRLGIFSGSGVGKSVLLSQISRFTQSDINVIGLIGERGREVKEFLQDYLGPNGLEKSIVIVATSDEAALMRRQAAYLTLTLAEYFRDQGKKVLCLMDSVTRLAMALREIGLTLGEPPTSKGYTPLVFSELPRLLERAGPGDHTTQGSITGLFTVLVEGDDHNEPIADAVRSILDGHVVLDRSIAERNRFPAINVLRSISRTMPECNTPEENALITQARELLAIYENMAEMIRLGAYRAGSDTLVDKAIHYYPKLEAFLAQGKTESCSLTEGFQHLKTILAGEPK